MLAAGGRGWLDNGSISALYAYSHKDISQNYKVGGGGTHIGNVGDDLLLSKQKTSFCQRACTHFTMKPAVPGKKRFDQIR